MLVETVPWAAEGTKQSILENSEYKEENMIKITKNRTGTSSHQASRWVLWVGYVSCAWGMWFAALHASLFFQGGSFAGQSQFAHNPWVYGLSSALSVLLFTSAALFPLALVWPFRWMSQPRMQIITLILAYIGMIGFTIYEHVLAQEPGVALAGAGVCVLGVVVALVRPRSQNVAHWMVLIATWIIGVGMALYGGAYVSIAFFQPTFEKGLGYFLLGGVNFTVEGILFVATAWLTSQRGQVRREV